MKKKVIVNDTLQKNISIIWPNPWERIFLRYFIPNWLHKKCSKWGFSEENIWQTVETNFLLIDLPTQNYLLKNMMQHVIFLESEHPSVYRNGKVNDGYILMIQEVDSNDIVGIIWGEGVLMMNVKSSAEKQWRDIPKR